jgi:hypothetical protein
MTADVEGCETESWPQGRRGGAPLKASAETPQANDAHPNSETARPLVAEVDHFRSLRAR